MVKKKTLEVLSALVLMSRNLEQGVNYQGVNYQEFVKFNCMNGALDLINNGYATNFTIIIKMANKVILRPNGLP